MASFRRKGNGWEASIQRKGAPRRSKTFSTKSEATFWAAEVEKEILAGKKGGIPNKRFIDLLERYANEVSPTKKSAEWEVKRINAMRNYDIANVKLADLSASDFAVWRDFRLKTVSTGTVLREMNLLSHAINTAIKEWGWLKENPLSNIRRPAAPKSRDRLITDHEIEKLLYALCYEYDKETDSVSQRVAAAMLFAIETAMRASEITNLTWHNVNLEKRTALLVETKNGTNRNVPLSTEAVRILKQVKNDKYETVFGIKSSQIDSLFRKAKKRTMTSDLHFHDTRHLAITRLAKKLDVLELARMVGHKDLRQLMVYYNETAEQLAKKLD